MSDGGRDDSHQSENPYASPRESNRVQLTPVKKAGISCLGMLAVMIAFCTTCTGVTIVSGPEAGVCAGVLVLAGVVVWLVMNRSMH
jgi:hypothetical protein